MRGGKTRRLRERERESEKRERERWRREDRETRPLPGRFPAKTPLNCSSKLSVSPLESLTFILKMCSSSEKSNRLIARGNEPSIYKNT